MALTVVAWAGVYVAAFAGSRLGVYLMLVGFGGQLLAHVALAIVAYRETMSREWPRVAPLRDDDDDW